MSRILTLIPLLVATTGALGLLGAGVGCASVGTTRAVSSDGSGEAADDARALYEEAYLDFRDDDCLEAEPKFRRVRREFPYSRYAALADLRVGDCQIQTSAYAEAIQTFQSFVRYRASHPLVSYARFRIAETHFKQIPSDWFLAPPSHERDLGEARDALRHLRRFVLDHPTDENVPAALDMARRALNVLARHELYVAKFYEFRDDYHGVAMRLERLLYAYEGASVEAEAMWLLVKAYRELGRPADAMALCERLVATHPDTDEGRSAAARLANSH
jgi:outer membrane protein assembly factor BamD